ncbi:MAG: hypothetical protein Q4D79_11860 [Propionibacteriaceae bacterium]|nr:hypothetical protein [Propionibacteriaceae bacterium]
MDGQMQLELGAQQRAAAIVAQANGEAQESLSVLPSVVAEHAPQVAGSASAAMVDVVSKWMGSFKVLTADLQGYADALVAVDRDVAETDASQRESFIACDPEIVSRMGG